jgi:hypothetical protein
VEQGDPIQRYFLDAHGADDDALAEGFLWLVTFARENGHERAAVFVPSLGQVENLSRAIGPAAATRLGKDRQIRIDGVTVDLLIERKLSYALRDGPILAVWVDDEQLDKLDSLRAPGICAIPWVRTDIDGWKANWNPVDIRTGESSGNDETILNPVVVKAMETLTAAVNLGTGLSHPYKESAVQMLKLLKKGGEDYDPDQIRAWAVRNGWQPRHARKLAELAEKIAEGRRVKGGKRQVWRDGVIDLWRNEAEKAGT